MPSAAHNAMLSITAAISAPVNAMFMATNLPWTLKAGESLMDNFPIGANAPVIVDYANPQNKSFADSLGDLCQASSDPIVVRLPAGVYLIDDLSWWKTNDWRQGTGFVSSSKFGGFIGAGADKTFIRLTPTAMQPEQRDYWCNVSASKSESSGNPVLVSFLRIGPTTALGNDMFPIFVSGVTFQGQLQQTSSYAVSWDGSGNGIMQTGPMPYAGVSFSNLVEGSVIQYCRFQGASYAAMASPPFETASMNSNRSTYVFRRSEIDGRVASGLNGGGQVSSGGYMWNREQDVRIEDSWLHHTRRSGWATNTDTQDTTESYYAKNFQVEHIADTADANPGTGLGFNASNVEAVIGTFTYENCFLSVSTGSHINWVVPAVGGQSGNPYTLPDHAVIKVRGFRTDNTDTSKTNGNYGGCLVINATTNGPVRTQLQSGGPDASGLFDIKTTSGSQLSGVKSSSWVAGTHTPDKNFVVIY